MAGPLYNVALAQRINHAHGGAVIAAWEVSELDESTYTLFSRLTVQGTRDDEGIRKTEEVKASYRRQFLH